MSNQLLRQRHPPPIFLDETNESNSDCVNMFSIPIGESVLSQKPLFFAGGKSKSLCLVTGKGVSNLIHAGIKSDRRIMNLN